MQIHVNGNGHMPASQVNQQRSDLSSISSYNYDEFVSGQSVSSERPKSEKFQQFIDNKKRMKADPDGVSSSLSDRTKLHLSRAKKLVNSGRSITSEESTVRLSYTGTDSLTNNSSESRPKHRTLLARKNSLVKRFEEREDNQIYEPISLPVEKENINRSEPTGNTRNIDDNTHDDTEMEETRSIHWDTKTVIQEQSRIRGILESRLGTGYINRPRETDPHREAGATIFFLPKTEPPEITDSTEKELKEHNTTEIIESESDSLEEDTRDSLSEDTEGEYTTLEDSLLEEDHSTLASSVTTLDNKVHEEVTDHVESSPPENHNVSQAESPTDSQSKTSENSVDTDRLRKAASRLRPVFEELRILSTKSESRRKLHIEVSDDLSSEIEVKADPPSVCPSGEKSTRSLAMQHSMSTYDLGSEDKYAAPCDEKSSAEGSGTSGDELKLESNIGEVQSVNTLGDVKEDDRSSKPESEEQAQKSGDISIHTWDENVVVDDHRDIDNQGTDLDSIADMVISDKNQKKKLHASSRSFPQINNGGTLSLSNDSQCEIAVSNTRDDVSCMSKSTGVSSRVSNIAEGRQSIPRALSSKTSVKAHTKMQRSPRSLQSRHTTRSHSVPRGRSSNTSVRAEVNVLKSQPDLHSRHSRAQSVPRGRSSKVNVSSNRRMQKSPPGVRHSRRSMSPARSRSSNNSLHSRHLFRRNDSFESVPREPENEKKQRLLKNAAPTIQLKPSTLKNTLSVPPRPTTAVYNSTRNGAREWFRNNGHENYENESIKSEPSLSFESAGLNTLESETFDNKSLSNTNGCASFEECRDPPEGNDPPGKMRVGSKKTRPSFLRNVSKHLSRQMSPPSSRYSKQPTIREDEESNNDDLESLRVKPLKTEPRDPVDIAHEDQSTKLEMRSHSSEDIIEINRSVEQREPVECEEIVNQVEWQPEKRARSGRLGYTEPPTTIFETENSMDSSILSSTIETLEAENLDLKRQLASMMELLEETDASVAYLQEALKRGQSSKLQLGPSQSRRSFRSSRRSIYRARE